MASSRIHEGKLAIVTGSARPSSIGEGIAKNLAEKGANVLIVYLTEGSDKPGAALAQELQSRHNVTAVPCRADISTPEGVKAVIEACKAKFPASPKTGRTQIDIIINCAATMPTGPVDLVSPEEFHRCYATNVLGPILLVGAAKPHLPTDRSGRIVNISSTGQKCGLPYLTLYSGSKGALEAMTKTWARELAESCTVNAINPGPVMTDLLRNCSEDVLAAQALWNPLTPLAGPREWDTEEVQAFAKRWGGRPAYVEEIAGVVAIICNPESGWMTGSMVSANGGLCFST